MKSWKGRGKEISNLKKRGLKAHTLLYVNKCCGVSGEEKV